MVIQIGFYHPSMNCKPFITIEDSLIMVSLQMGVRQLQLPGFIGVARRLPTILTMRGASTSLMGVLGALAERSILSMFVRFGLFKSAYAWCFGEASLPFGICNPELLALDLQSKYIKLKKYNIQQTFSICIINS